MVVKLFSVQSCRPLPVPFSLSALLVYFGTLLPPRRPQVLTGRPLAESAVFAVYSRCSSGALMFSLMSDMENSN